MLTKEELLEIEKIFQTWLFKFSDLDNKIYNFYETLKNLDFSAPINSFTKRLASIPYTFSKSEEVSGSICYFGSIFTSLLNTGKIEQIEGLFTFALCYMLVDHFLDDNQIHKEEKKETIKELSDFLFLGKDSKNPLILAASERYHKLVTETPRCKKDILKLFESEIKGSIISSNQNLSREDYSNIVKEKGGGTSQAIASIIGLEDLEKENNIHFQVGVCIQLVDDLLDIWDDTKLDIYTLARYDFSENNLDRYLYETVLKINELNSIYNFFKVILLSGCILASHKIEIPKELKEIFQKYDFFSKDTDKDTLNDWFQQKLYEYIDLKENERK